MISPHVATSSATLCTVTVQQSQGSAYFAMTSFTNKLITNIFLEAKQRFFVSDVNMFKLKVEKLFLQLQFPGFSVFDSNSQLFLGFHFN